MKRLKITVFIISITLIPSYVWADTDSGLNYEQIVNQLSVTTTSPTVIEYSHPLDHVKFHLGVGLTNSLFSIPLPLSGKTFVAQRGVQAVFGIDLLSKNWIAEISALTYGSKKYNETAFISLREFDLKILYRGSISKDLGFRGGLGLGARYLKYQEQFGPTINDFTEEQTFKTPVSILSAGLEAHINSKFSFVAEVSARTALIEETPENSAYDFVVRLDGHL